MKQDEEERARIYQSLIDAGVRVESTDCDLYVPVNPITNPIIEGYRFRSSVRTCSRERALWYEIPLAYMPYWQARAAQREKPKRKIVHRVTKGNT